MSLGLRLEPSPLATPLATPRREQQALALAAQLSHSNSDPSSCSSRSSSSASSVAGEDTCTPVPASPQGRARSLPTSAPKRSSFTFIAGNDVTPRGGRAFSRNSFSFMGTGPPTPRSLRSLSKSRPSTPSSLRGVGMALSKSSPREALQKAHKRAHTRSASTKSVEAVSPRGIKRKSKSKSAARPRTPVYAVRTLSRNGEAPAPALAVEASVQCFRSTAVPTSPASRSAASDKAATEASRSMMDLDIASNGGEPPASPSDPALKSALVSLSTPKAKPKPRRAADRSRRYSMSTSESSSIVELRKLLADEYEEPLTAKKFQEFVLKNEFGDESIQFHNRVMRFKLSSDNVESVSLIKEIYEQHLAQDSPHEINVGGELRLAIIKDIRPILEGESLESQHVDRRVFNEALGEVERLLYQNSLPKFVKHSIENLNDNAAVDRARLLSAIGAFVVSVVLAVVLVLSSITPWARVALNVPITFGLISFVQYRTRV